MSYRVYKAYSGTNKCVRKFDSLDEAKTWCWTRDNGATYRIEWTVKADEEHCIPERRYRIFV